MKKAVKKIRSEPKKWKDEIVENKKVILISLVFLIIATISTYIAGTYADGSNGVVSSDLFLDNLPAIDLSFIYIYGFILVFLVLLAYPLFWRVNYLHTTIGQLSLLMMIRSIFMCFTHLKIPADAIIATFSWPLSFLNFQNDLFFSGHAAFSFLGFLLFKEHKIRYFFLVTSIVMAATVILMHVHYSIDVFSAFFITYGSVKIGEMVFKNK